jgi:protoheme IX farnesyltransferase
MAAIAQTSVRPFTDGVRLIASVFKLRIGVAIMLSALAGLAVAGGEAPTPWQIAALALAILLSAASAGALNQYVERESDARMPRTRNRPFVTGRLKAGPFWLAVILAVLIAAVLLAGLALNWAVAFHAFMGAFVYGVVYTIWLKHRTWLNIVVGGLAGSFAVLAGAAAVGADLAPAPLALAVALFFWTPPHFWSLAMAVRDQYAAAGVPMLPVVVGDGRAARIILAHTVIVVALSLLPAFMGMGPVYLICAFLGGVLFVHKSIALARAPSRHSAMANFHASLIQLGLLQLGAMADRLLLG